MGLNETMAMVAVLFVIAAIFYRPGSFEKKRNKQKEDVAEIEKNRKTLESTGVYGLLSKEELENEDNYISKRSENAYIQNNTKAITDSICVLTPTFNSNTFMDFAKDIFKKLVVSQDKMSLGSLVSDKVDMHQIPTAIDRYDICFMHNYIVEDKHESIKLLFNVHSKKSLSSRTAEQYFVTFSRENQLLSLTHGEVITVSCPHCGGNLSFGRKTVKTCPYCGNTVTFAEYDWVLTKVEHINDDTVITNRAVIKNKK